MPYPPYSLRLEISCGLLTLQGGAEAAPVQIRASNGGGSRPPARQEDDRLRLPPRREGPVQG